jgi:hypothetical protein
MGHAFGWDAGEGAMDLEKDLFAHYTLLRRPGGSGAGGPGAARGSPP